MSDIPNKKAIKISKRIMEDMGIEITTSQLYEFLSRLAGYKNWHAARADSVNFEDLALALRQKDENHDDFNT